MNSINWTNLGNLILNNEMQPQCVTAPLPHQTVSLFNILATACSVSAVNHMAPGPGKYDIPSSIGKAVSTSLSGRPDYEINSKYTPAQLPMLKFLTLK